MEFSFDRILAIFGAIAVPAALGVGVAMDTKTIGELRFAHACFILSALVVITVVAVWGITTDVSVLRRVAIVMVLFATVGSGMVESIRWAQQRHEHAESSASTGTVTKEPVATNKSIESTPMPSAAASVSETAHTPSRDDSSPAAPSATVPNVTLRFVLPDMPAVVLVNSSRTVAKEMKWGVALWNRDRPDDINPLQIPISAFDWLKANSESAPLGLFGGVQSQLRPGDRLVGSAFVDCPECGKGHTYLVSITYGQGGWFTELKSDKAGGWATPVNTTKDGREAYFAAIDRVPESERIPITPQ